MKEIPEGKSVILFDGTCNFCDTFINKIITLDKKNQFVFASLQSEIGKKIRNHIGLSETIDSIILYQPGYAYYVKSDAALEILERCNSWTSVFQIFKIFPKSLRDSAYDYVAKNRYKWFGEKSECALPSEEIKKKFLD